MLFSESLSLFMNEFLLFVKNCSLEIRFFKFAFYFSKSFLCEKLYIRKSLLNKVYCLMTSLIKKLSQIYLHLLLSEVIQNCFPHKTVCSVTISFHVDIVNCLAFPDETNCIKDNIIETYHSCIMGSVWAKLFLITITE